MRHGGHLYASWRGTDGGGGVAVWSLADPLEPELVAEFDDYTNQARRPTGVAVANDHLYLFDQDRGVFVASLDDPTQLQLMPAGITSTGVPYASVVAHGDMIHASGRNFIGRTVLHVYDASALSDPANPTEIGRLAFTHASTIATEGGYAYLAKNTNGPLLGVADVSNPAEPALAWQANLPARPHQLRVHAGHLYLAENPAAPAVVGRYQASRASDSRIAQRGDRAWFGDVDGLHQLDVSDPTAPVLVALSALGQSSPRALYAAGDGRLLALGDTTGVHVFAAGDGEDVVPLENGVPARDLEAGQDEALLFSIQVPEGADMLQVLSYGGRGDADLQVRHGQPPTADQHDAASTRPGNNETVRIAAAAGCALGAAAAAR